MNNFPEEANKAGFSVSMASNTDAPLLAAIDEVEKLQGIFHKEGSYKSSSEDMLSEEDCPSSQWYSKQEELVECLFKMKGLMEEAELESMRLREEKKLLTMRIGESLVTVNTEMDALRKQLHDQDRMLRDLGANPLPYSSHEVVKSSSKSGLTVLVAEQTEQIISLQKKLLEYEQENSELRKMVYTSGKGSIDKNCENCNRLREYAGGLEIKLQKNKDFITSKRKEMKQLKSEKLELLDQLKQLYGTLEDKEKELRDFILNYEQRMKDSEETIKNLLSDKKRDELEKWNLLQKATVSSERCITLKTELDYAEENLKRKEGELRDKDEELMKLSQSYTKDDSVSGFFALFGRQVAKTDTLSETEDTTTSQYRSQEQESIDRNISTNERNFAKRPENLIISTNIDDPMLACSTPVPLSSDTQYLSLGTPDLAGDDAVSKETKTDSAFLYENFKLRTERRSASTELPPPEREKNASPVRRASSFKRKDGPRRVASPKHDRYKRTESPKSPADCKKPENSVSNGGVVKRQRSVNKRPRTFHPDIFDNVESTAEVPSPAAKEVQEPRSPRRKTLSGTLSRMFGRDKDRIDSGSGSKSPEAEVYDKWQVWDSIQRIPMPLWKARDVIVWLEIECCMPMYSKNCAKNIKSGKIMLQLSDHDLGNALGITNMMHRLKLKMALDDYRYPERRNVKLSKLDHTWISLSWLKDLGLSQFSELFEKNLVDGRMVNTFARKELEKIFGMTKKSHQISFACALQLLRKMNFDKEALNLRRSTCADRNIDILVWSNQRLIDWAHSIDLKEYAENLRDSGIHGALISYEDTFTIDTLAHALRIPVGKGAVYKHLVSEFSPLLKAAKSKVKPEDKLKNGKPKSSGLSRSFSLRWSRRERSKRLTPSRSTGNINGEQGKDDPSVDENKIERKGNKQATML